MSKVGRFFLLVVIVMSVLPCIFGGHLVDDFYKCSSDWYRSFFKRCKRNLEHTENSAQMTGLNTVMALLAVGLYHLL